MDVTSRLVSACALFALWTSVSVVFANEASEEVSRKSADPQVKRPSSFREVRGIHLTSEPTWSVGLSGYAGLTTYAFAEGTKGHAIAGGISRVQWSHLQIGGLIEVSDYAQERWRTLSGFVGGYFPFTNWVDLDAAIGFGWRRFVSTDLRYGPNGASVTVPTLTARIGISDRPFDTLIGHRIGAALLFGVDLTHRQVTWTYEFPGMEPIIGTTEFGGVTAGLVMSVGLEVAGFRDR